MGCRGEGLLSASVDGKIVSMRLRWQRISKHKLGRVHLEEGKALRSQRRLCGRRFRRVAPQLVWAKVDFEPSPEAIAAAKDADVVVAVVGITSELEGEEMQVSEEGFKGGDRTSIDLPKPEQDLLEADGRNRQAAGRGADQRQRAGRELGQGARQRDSRSLVSGRRRRSGHSRNALRAQQSSRQASGDLLQGVSQLPAFEDYSMKGRTYRYFEGTPLYPFGYGLSYTTFSYSGLKVPTKPVTAGDAVVASVTVTNTGKVAGDEVAQLYLSFPDVAGAPLKALRGFQRVHLEPGASQEVKFELKPRDLSIVSEAGEPVVPAGEFTVTIGGGQPDTGASGVKRSFHVKNTLTLPE